MYEWKNAGSEIPWKCGKFKLFVDTERELIWEVESCPGEIQLFGSVENCLRMLRIENRSVHLEAKKLNMKPKNIQHISYLNQHSKFRTMLSGRGGGKQQSTFCTPL